MRKIAIYPGTFDPITNGHIDIIERGCKIFEKVIVAVAKATNKECFFTLDERIHLANISIKHINNAEVEGFDGLAVNFVKSKKSSIMIRGFRAVSDFEYELQIAHANRTLCEDIETIFLTPKNKYLYLSSSLVKQIARLGGSIKEYVPDAVQDAIKNKMQKK
ncbi:MAG: pantetheine-phosphate adenylyltransferase [Candidatus Cloacimonetes bacterium]|nr:pantetheine-phosphate adenylyltransferase [Candidatus Cloacimonadota bacterium]MBL7085551.1 pantetheine-phosphate adenylyltransferase [Candidatus Cloacimonadota bacterium]